MSERVNELKVGTFVLAGLALILTGLVVFALRRNVEPTYEFETYVEDNVDGLSVGSAVKLRGVIVGSVTGIGFSWKEYPPGNPRCVVIRFSIARSRSPILSGGDEDGQLNERLEKGLRAVVQGEGITGNSILALKYRTDPSRYPPMEFPWKPKSFYIPSAPSEFNQVLAAVNNTLASVEKIDFEAIGKSVELVGRDVHEKLQGVDSRGISTELQRTLVEARSTVREMRAQLDGMHLQEVGKNANDLIVGLEGTNARLQQTASQFSNIDFRDLNAALAKTNDVANELNSVLEDLKAYPSGFLFGDSPAPASVLAKEKK
jgi:ABC-type transporter Mla subunit MlaD